MLQPPHALGGSAQGDDYEHRIILVAALPYHLGDDDRRMLATYMTDTNLPSHYSMVGDIHRTLMSWSPAIFVGFNSIRFDEEMLRHALFQSLYPAYLTSNHRNCRADALSLMMAVNAVSPEQLVVPIGEEGQRTFRLHHLASANGVVHTHAHVAIEDLRRGPEAQAKRTAYRWRIIAA